ncbi:serine protease [Roseateles sp.]|uniref:S1 family peptidase n=1 Tax=Roseateles sp. TaxID=1971397 RepID=UPI0025FC9650|nr:serine protease [Roseateles sp.]
MSLWKAVVQAAVVALGILGLPPAWGDANLPGLIARAKPAVVLVGSYGLLDAPRFGFRGTGFAVGDGMQIVTNAHVLPPLEQGRIDRSVAIQAWTPESGWLLRGARIAKVDASQDLALLRIDDGKPLPTLPLAEQEAVEGEMIALIGFPIGGALGFSHVTHRGIVSARTAIVPPASGPQGLSERAVRQLRQGSFEVLQLDATAYPGNSGGPVINIATGAVVGVVSMVAVKAAHESALTAPSGISYAIPVGSVRSFLSDAAGGAGR